MNEAKRDGNYVTTLLAVSNADGVTPVVLWADPVTHRLLTSATGGGGAPFADNAALVKNNADNTKLIIVSAAGITTGTTRTITAPDANTTLPIATQVLTFAGPTLARTITFPDASITVARTDAANTFTGHQTLEGVTSTGATGTGKLVFDGTPTLVTPILGVATATSINKLAITAPATGATLAVADGKTLTASNTLTFTGNDGSSVNFGSGGTVSYGGGVTWTEVTGTTQAGAVNNGYILNNASLVTLTIPSTAALGDRIYLRGKGAGLYKVAQNASQTIHFGNTDTTTGTGGSLTAIGRYSCIELTCITANTDFVVSGVQGNFTIA